jgi:hypothetical protein
MMHLPLARIGSHLMLSCALTLAVAGAAIGQPRSGAVAASYPALEELRDWSGWWTVPAPLADEWVRQPPPLKDGILDQRLAARTQDFEGDPLRYCRPPQFTGYSGGFVDAVEFLFTPGRVTLTNESGLVRRIYTDGRPLPTDVDPSNTGTSIGHWEGQTLVVETIGINPAAAYPAPQQGAIPIGTNVRITERISLEARDTLRFDIVTVAPDVLREPDRRTRIYSRVVKAMANEITFCAEYDRSIDPVTGKQRFDLTPPADLPPPPPR